MPGRKATRRDEEAPKAVTRNLKGSAKATKPKVAASRKTPTTESSKLKSSATAKPLHVTTTSTNRKRKAITDEKRDVSVGSETRPSKQAKISVELPLAKAKHDTSKKIGAKRKGSQPSHSISALPLTINQQPTEVLAILVLGSGECGELGLGPKKKASILPRVNPFLDPNDPSKFHVVQLSCGGMHAVALTSSSQIVTWGVNDNSALGRDTTWSDERLRDVDDGSDTDDDEDLNPHESTPAEIPSHYFSHAKLVQVAAGDSCSFALTDTGLVYGWGTFLNSKGRPHFGYDNDNNPINKQAQPKLIPGFQNIVQIACGANHMLALDRSGSVWGWGCGEQNQLGRRPFGRHQETFIPKRIEVGRGKVKYIASGEYHSFAVDGNDNVWGWGLNSFGEAGDAKSAGGNAALLPYPVKIPELCKKGVVVLDGGAHHSAAVTAGGQCLVWGRLDGGQLGIKFTTEQLEDTTLIRYDEYEKPRICLRPTAVPDIGDVVHVGCGTDHTIFINKQGDGFATGFGSSGQLGLGSEDDHEIAQRMCGKKVEERALLWASAGGQFSIVAATAAKSKESY